MRENNQSIERFRVLALSDASYGNNGAFAIKRGSTYLRVIASDGEGWDHVSVSLPTRCPTWEEMSFVKRLFFHDEECVMQLHPPASEHINCHEFCLHLWRPQGKSIPQPPGNLVGPTQAAKGGEG